MFREGLKSSLGSFLKRIWHNTEREEVEALRHEVEALRRELQGFARTDAERGNGSGDRLCSNEDVVRRRDVDVLKLDIEILRNEILEDIAAIHRLEILTLSERMRLLNEFGKSLPPTIAGRTRKSLKPRGFSFGIITNGRRNDKLARLIESIRRQNLTADRYEILIAGCVEEFTGHDGVRTFPMVDAANQGRLGAMRNVLARAACFNKFVCLDDDFLVHPGWAEAVERVNGDFDVATGIILNPDLTRYCDWVNIIENFTFLRTYQEMFDKCQYVTGGYGIYKDFIFLEHSWNDDLGFYQGEDVSFSRRLFDAGYQLKFIPEAIVMHDDERYRQKGYGVVRLKSAEECMDTSLMSLRIERLCPRTLS